MSSSPSHRPIIGDSSAAVTTRTRRPTSAWCRSYSGGSAGKGAAALRIIWCRCRATVATVSLRSSARPATCSSRACVWDTFLNCSSARSHAHEAAYRLTLFGRFTYTQETFIDLFSKGLRMAEVPLKVRGVREHGDSRVASSILKYATNSLPIILRAMRDIQPLKFFGGIALLLFIPGMLLGGFVTGYYLLQGRTSPYTSFITMSGVAIVLSFLLGVLALLADMRGRHRKISEELLYLARRKVYAGKRAPHRPVMASIEPRCVARSMPCSRRGIGKRKFGVGIIR